MTNIIVVDDHAVVRKGLRAILESSRDRVSVEEASCFEEAMAKVRKAHFDAVILDFTLPGKSGLDTLRQIKKERPTLPVLMLSVHRDRDYGVRTLKAGAAGYLDKSAAPERLLEAVERVLRGRRYLSSELSEHLAEKIADDAALQPHEQLSEREFEVFCLIAFGASTAEAAEKLSLSPKTVHTHRRGILNKLNLKSNADMVRYAYQHRLIE
jgi:two-component system invasion response regulator UvrY